MGSNPTHPRGCRAGGRSGSVPIRQTGNYPNLGRSTRVYSTFALNTPNAEWTKSKKKKRNKQTLANKFRDFLPTPSGYMNMWGLCVYIYTHASILLLSERSQNGLSDVVSWCGVSYRNAKKGHSLFTIWYSRAKCSAACFYVLCKPYILCISKKYLSVDIIWIYNNLRFRKLQTGKIISSGSLLRGRTPWGFYPDSVLDFYRIVR